MDYIVFNSVNCYYDNYDGDRKVEYNHCIMEWIGYFEYVAGGPMGFFDAIEKAGNYCTSLFNMDYSVPEKYDPPLEKLKNLFG